MNWRYSSLALLLFLAACDGSSSSDPHAQSSSTFGTPPTTGETSKPASTDVVVEDGDTNNQKPPSTEVVVEDGEGSGFKPPPLTLAQVLIMVRAGRAKEIVAAGIAIQYGTQMAEAGYEDEAFALLAPLENKLEDHNTYDTTTDGTIDPKLIDETPSSMHHTLKIGGKDVSFTARAGHLIAYAPKDPKDPDKKDAEVAVFYTAYTRDGLPKEKRPVTFFWNGGPGSASIWLHMGSWAPWRLKSDAPNIPEQFYYNQPESFPFEANAITLLDKTDLVFVDPAGTGYSTALAPHKNQDFWGTDADGKLISDFITRYNNVNNRQSSPKYLYGESYGGIRTPIVADLLEGAGTSRFEPDASGKPPVVLTGFVLNSPLLNYASNCNMLSASGSEIPAAACAGYLPSYAMTADFFQLSAARGNASQEDYHRALEDYVTNTYVPTLVNNPNEWDPQTGLNPWETYAATADGVAFANDLAKKTGITADWWQYEPDLPPYYFQQLLIPGSTLGRYDARMKIPSDATFGADDWINVAFLNQSKTYFPDYVNYVYSGSSTYQPINNETIQNWTWPHRGSVGLYSPASIVDLQDTLAQDPAVKLLILHGYEDIATPGFQTELDLKGVDLSARVPVKWFEGGHMIYNTEVSRAPLKAELDKYYDDPHYSVLPPAAAVDAAAAAVN